MVIVSSQTGESTAFQLTVRYMFCVIKNTNFLLCNKLEAAEPRNVRTSSMQVIMLEILEMFTVKHLLKVKLTCITELGYNYLKCIFNKTSSCQISEL